MKVLRQKYLYIVALLVVMIIEAKAQCPQNLWDASNIGSAYVDERGNKSVYGKMSNISGAQFVNDGNFYLFGDLHNDGLLGDGLGYEYIKRCDGSVTAITGQGLTEFNILSVDNPAGVDLDKDIKIKTNLEFTNGIIHTDRNIFRERVFFLEGATYLGANDNKHVDGSIARQGQGAFIFPLGDGDHMSPLQVRGENAFDIFISTYHSTNQGEEQFLSKGTYPTDALDFNLHRVQPKEFWTLTGGQATKVTLFWTQFSEISELTEDVNDLVVVGWDGEKWVSLGNTELLQTFGTGTVTSSSVIPNRYDAYTFGVLDSDGDGIPDSKDVDPFDPCSPDPVSEACMNRVCVTVQTSVYLEGALQLGGIGEYGDEMRSTLNNFGYLPGQRPKTLLGVATSAGQPYDRLPWFYSGMEGLEFDAFKDGASELYPGNGVDWVLVSLRTRPNVESTVCSTSALLLNTGEVYFTEFFDCCDMNDEEYYIVIEHRNHLPVMTPTPMPVVNGVVAFDFRESNSYVRLLGNGQKEIKPGVFAMYAGNGDQITAPDSPSDINANDISLWTKDNGKHSGYYFQDYDLSGDVNVHDKATWLTNNGVFTDVDR